MTQILVAYGTTEGHTGTIAAFVADVLREQGHEVTVADVEALETIPDTCAAVILAGSVHVGKHDAQVVDFAAANLEALTSRSSAFVSVSLALVGDTAEAQKYVQDFEAASGWTPEQVSLVAGALLYTQYGFAKRQLMRGIAASKRGALSTDTGRDHVYTDWDAVRRFAEDFAAQVAAAA